MIKKCLILLLSLPKTIYFNFRTFKFSVAIFLPIFLKYDVKISETHKGAIELKDFEKKHYRIKYGIGGSKHICPNKYSFISIGKKGKVIFNGKGAFGEGCSIRCDYGKLEFGKNISANKNCCINCEYKMKFGDDVLLGWNINIRDTDGHQIFSDGVGSILQKEILIGNHVWICSYSDLLKGCKVGNDSVIAWKSLVLKSFEKDNILIGGSPAKIIKENIIWKE